MDPIISSYLLELAKYAPPIVAVALGLGYLLYRLGKSNSENLKEQSMTHSDNLTKLMGNHIRHLEEAVDRNTDVIAEASHVQKDTRRVLERLLDRL